MTRSSTTPFAVAALSVLALTGALATAVVVHEPAPTEGAASGPGGAPGSASTPARLSAPASCDDLLADFHRLGARAVNPWGWRNFSPFVDGFGSRTALSTDETESAAGERTTEQSNSATGTNVQETGIDEPDVAKVDDGLLVRVERRKLTTYDVSGDRVRTLGSLRLPGRAGAPEVLLQGDRALVIDTRWTRRGDQHTQLWGIDLTDPAAPSLADTHQLDGELLSARMTGTDVRVVTASGLPDIDFVHPTRHRTRQEARRENRQRVRATTIDDWLPTVSDDGTERQLLGCDAVHVPDELATLGLLSIVGFPIDDPAERDATAIATASRIVYTAADRLYVATNPWGFCCVLDAARVGGAAGATDVHAFALTGTEAVHRASGRVAGTVSDRWSLDSVDGVLRVALAVPAHEEQRTGKRVKPHNAVVTLREEAGTLEEMGRVDGLGVNEEIQSVRWFDDFAVLVTFRQVDPLYAVDLSTQSTPTLLGELKIPGFSAYLHPIGSDRLLGIGLDADERGRNRGAQASTFDVSSPGSPEQVDKVTYGRRADLNATWEPRQFTWLPDRAAALTPVTRWNRTGAEFTLSVLEVAGDGTLDQHEIPLAGSWQAAESLRTLPLPDGRVVIASTAEVRFLDW